MFACENSEHKGVIENIYNLYHGWKKKNTKLSEPFGIFS